MISKTYVRALLWWFVGTMWLPAIAMAAQTSREQQLMAISIPVALTALVMATVSGMSALALRFDAELRKSNGVKLPMPWLFAVSNLLGSWVSGALAFFWTESGEYTVHQQMALVMGASFLGARMIERAAEAYLSRFPGKPGGLLDAASKPADLLQADGTPLDDKDHP